VASGPPDNTSCLFLTWYQSPRFRFFFLDAQLVRVLPIDSVVVRRLLDASASALHFRVLLFRTYVCWFVPDLCVRDLRSDLLRDPPLCFAAVREDFRIDLQHFRVTQPSQSGRTGQLPGSKKQSDNLLLSHVKTWLVRLRFADFLSKASGLLSWAVQK
jgi:hypothetical protein